MTDALTNLDRLAEMWADLDPGDDWRPHIRDAIREIIRLRAALAAPPVAPGWIPAPARVPAPLTDEQIDRITTEQWGRGLGAPYAAYRAYARAVEAAHGIAAPGAPDAPQSHPQR